MNSIKSSITYIFTTFFNQLISVITIPIFTRALSTSDYGLLALVQAFGLFVAGIAHLGLNSVYDRNFFEYRKLGKENILLFTLLIFVILVSICFGAIIFTFKEQIAVYIFKTKEIEELLTLGFAVFTLIYLKNYFLAYYKNSENSKSYSKIYSCENVFSNVLGLFFVLVLEYGIKGVLLGQLLSNGLIFSVLFLNFVKKNMPSFSIKGLWDSLALSIPLIPKIFLGIINTEFDKYMLTILKSVSGVGIYSVGQRLSNVVFTYMNALQNTYSPKVYSRMFDLDRKKRGYEIGALLTPFAYFSVAFALVVTLFCEEAVYILTPKSYHQAIEVVVILTFYLSILFFGKHNQLLFAKKVKTIFAINFLQIAANIGLNILFIRQWGVIGAALATLTTGLLVIGVAFPLYQRAYKIYWEYKRLIMIYGTLLLACLSILILRQIPDTYLFRVVLKFLFIGIFLLIGNKCEIINIARIKDLKYLFSPRLARSSEEVE